MSLTGIKDLDREILKYIPEENLLKLCAINNRMYNEYVMIILLKGYCRNIQT